MPVAIYIYIYSHWHYVSREPQRLTQGNTYIATGIMFLESLRGSLKVIHSLHRIFFQALRCFVYIYKTSQGLIGQMGKGEPTNKEVN